MFVVPKLFEAYLRTYPRQETERCASGTHLATRRLTDFSKTPRKSQFAVKMKWSGEMKKWVGLEADIRQRQSLPSAWSLRRNWNAQGQVCHRPQHENFVSLPKYLDLQFREARFPIKYKHGPYYLQSGFLSFGRYVSLMLSKNVSKSAPQEKSR